MKRSADPYYLRRLALAVALSLAIHEVVAGLSHWPRHHARPEVVARTERVTISIRTPEPTPTPPPRAKPTPRPTPPPVVQTPTPIARFTVAPRIVVAQHSAPKAAARVTASRGGAAAPLHVVHVTPSKTVTAPEVAVQNGTNAGVANGGAGTGGGSGTGTGGDGGTANGTGGNGTNEGDPTAPCGDVDFHPLHMGYERGGAVDQQVAVTVSLRDGQSIDGMFPYAFKYPSLEQNPFHNDAMLVNGGIAVQFPPQGFDTSGAPLAVQLVLKYSNPATGFTSLPKCPPEAVSTPAS